MNKILQYFHDIFELQSQSRLTGFPFFLWVFIVPLLLVLTITTWFNVRIFVGTLITVLVAYLSGLFLVKTRKGNDTKS